MSIPPTNSSMLQVSCGNVHCCGLLSSNNSIVCWGSNSLGQLNVPSAYQPFLYVSAGFNFNCAVRVLDGSIVCWGYSANPANLQPVIGNGFASIVSGSNVACTILALNNTINCWGDNTNNLLTLPSVFVYESILAGVGYQKVGIVSSECVLGKQHVNVIYCSNIEYFLICRSVFVGSWEHFIVVFRYLFGWVLRKFYDKCFIESM